jgi:hypothetical protein
MSQITELHHRAMEAAEAAEVARLQGQDGAAEFWRSAFEAEKQAALLCAADTSYEPTRSVLHRSAATLALRCKEFREAERLIAAGLAGEPPEEIAGELRDLLEQVNFEWHLSLRGLVLSPEELQFTIAGKAVGFGMAVSEEFVRRIQTLERLIYRTAERKLGNPYREKAVPDQAVRKWLEVCVSVPRAASFAVSVRLGRPSEQGTFAFPDAIEPADVMGDVVNGLDLLNQGEADKVRAQIPNEAYYRNFVGNAKKLAPDGSEIRLVGITLVRGREHQEVQLTRPAAAFVDFQPPGPDGVPVTVQGTLKYADDTKKKAGGEIRLVGSGGKAQQIIVPEGMMNDIVKPLWGLLVIVRGVKVGGAIRLNDIQPAESGNS